MGKSTINGQFSIAMLVYRRVPFFFWWEIWRDVCFCWLVSKFGELGWSFVTTLILFLGSCWVFSDGRTSENISKHVLPSHNDEPLSYHISTLSLLLLLFHHLCHSVIIRKFFGSPMKSPTFRMNKHNYIYIYIYMYHQYVQPYLKTIPETTLSHIKTISKTISKTRSKTI